VKETQTDKVTYYLFINGKSDNKTIADDLGIISHNVRRITGQETLKGNYERVAKGVYVLSESKLKEYQELYRKVG
jgi:predicted transcriptional regulator of viral defense system|tara:strand:- start:189 stop:413 length:225 start_codon:yes stop_codon:yes gene_type:complete